MVRRPDAERFSAPPDGGSGTRIQTSRLVFIDDLVKFDAETRRAAVAILLQRLPKPRSPGCSRSHRRGAAPLGRDAEPAAKILASRLQRKGRPGGSRDIFFLLGKLGPVAKPAVPAIPAGHDSERLRDEKSDFLNPFWRSSRTLVPMISVSHSAPKTGPTHEILREYGVRVLCGIDREAELQGIRRFHRNARSRYDQEPDSPRIPWPARRHRQRSGSDLAEGMEAVAVWSYDANQAVLIFETIHHVGNCDDPLLVEVLVRMLKSKGSAQRTGAVIALGSLSPPPKGVVPALVAAMKDEQPVVRRGASDSLGRYLGSERKTALHALLAAMDDQDLWVRINAGRSLASHGEVAAEGSPPIIRLLRNEDPNVRGQAAEDPGKVRTFCQVASAALLVAAWMT